MNEDHNAERPDGPVYPAEKARQGEVVLRTKAQRLIFIAGLAGVVIFALVMSFLLR